MSIKNFLLSWGMLLLGILLNVFGVYMIKLKINTLGNISFGSIASVFNYFLALIKIPGVVAGGIAIFAAPFPYAIALSRMQLSVAYPASVALNCLIIIPLTILFLGEHFTLNKLISVVCLTVSLYFLYK